MKSIIEQASSIMKAIEKAWDQAAKPKEFSIKIFEQEERNFFGMSVKPAKIGIFFNDKPVTHEKPTSKPRQEIKECRPAPEKPKHTHPQQQKAQPCRPEQPTRPATTSAQTTSSKTTTKPVQPAPAKTVFTKDTADRPSFAKASEDRPVQQRTHATPEKTQTTHTPEKSTQDKLVRIPAAWNDTMIAATHNWLKKTLSLMNMTSIDFNSEIAGKNLKLTFNTPLIADVMHEKQLFRSFAHLIMSSLRNQYKQEIKDLKVILIRPE